MNNQPKGKQLTNRTEILRAVETDRLVVELTRNLKMNPVRRPKHDAVVITANRGHSLPMHPRRERMTLEQRISRVFLVRPGQLV